MGEIVGNFWMGLGCSDVMQVNPYNRAIALGHSSGTVTMWNYLSFPRQDAMLTRTCFCYVTKDLFWH